MTATRLADDGPLRRLVDGSYVDHLCTLTLVVVVINSNEDPPLFLAALAALVVGVLRPGWTRTPWWWFATAAVLAVRQISDWQGIDNHVVVTTYWTLALALGLAADDPARVLARSARWIVGLVFGFAVYWKLASPDFLDGDFFRFTLLTDDRFDAVARWIGGVPNEAMVLNEASWLAVLRGDEGALLVGGPRLDALALFMAWFAIVTESFIAVAHLAPLRGRWVVLRPASLLFFCLGTYIVVPVGGFGCLLAVLALADDELTPTWRRAYLWLFAGLVVYGPIWWLLFG
jgi:hypothetical protein